MPEPSPFPPGFFDRQDESDDALFYVPERLVTHIDGAAIAAVGALYDELGLTSTDKTVLDLCSSWVSHLASKPGHLELVGMNARELAANPMADAWTVQDLNVDPHLAHADASFDAVTCAVSVDYLTRPLDVFAEVARLVRPGGPFVCTFSNRCFPTKAIRGWLEADDRGRCAIVAAYFRLTPAFDEAIVQQRNAGAPGDPLFSVTARRRDPP